MENPELLIGMQKRKFCNLIFVAFFRSFQHSCAQQITENCR